MKKDILLLALLALTISCNSQSPKNGKDMNTERLTYFSFDHHNTMALFYGEKYQVSAMKDGRIHIIIDEGFPKEKDFYIEDTTIFDELTAIVKQFKMDKYKDDYKPSMRIFDGDSWSLYYKYDSGRSHSSGGYMDWPSNYHEARQAISEYFQKWRDSAIEAKQINLFQYTSKNNQGCDIEYRLERGENEATLYIRNAEYNTDKQLSVSNDYLSELQELVNIHRLKDNYSRTTDEDSVTHYRYLVGYNTGDTIDLKGYYTTFISGTGSAFENFFDRWLPVRGNLVKLDYAWRANAFHNIKYYVYREDGRFSLMHYDEKDQKYECNLDDEVIPQLQQLIESFELDKAKDRITGLDQWTLSASYDSRDMLYVGGRLDDEASEAKARHILDALTEFFAPYLK